MVELSNTTVIYRKLLITFVCVGVGFIIFGNFPQIDLAISNYFWRSEHWVGRSQPWGIIREVYYYFSLLTVFYFLIMTIASVFKTTEISSKIYGFVLSVCITGPLLLTNGILKEHWGRARPFAVEEFGGELIFTPAQIFPVDQCAKNCSFVSGEASGAFVMIFLFAALFAKSKSQTLFIWLLFLPMAFLRIAAGKHFTSDVLFAFMFMYIIYQFNLLIFKVKKNDIQVTFGALWRDTQALFSRSAPNS